MEKKHIASDSLEKELLELRHRAENKMVDVPVSLDTLSPEETQQLVHELHVHQIELTMQNEALRQAYLELEVSRNKFMDLYDFAPVGYLTLNETGIILEANLTMGKLLGVARNDLIKRPLSRFIINENADTFYLHHKRLVETHESQTYTLKMTGPDSNPFYAQIEEIVQKNSAGEMTYRASVSDITEWHRTEQERLKSANLESLGLLAGGITHDFNNLLTGIYGNTQLIGMILPDDHKAHKYLERVDQTIKRAMHLTKQLLTFAKGGSPVKEHLDTGILLHETAEFSLHGSNINLKTDIKSDLWGVEADRGQLSQVISNLIINARQAMPQGGTVTLTAENIKLPDGLYVQIKIEDEGLGIAPQHLDNIFDPYFSTKTDGHGLGLASAYSIIKRHNGRITVDSPLNQGAVFTIYLPATAETEETGVGKAVREAEDVSVSSGRILLLDDELVILEAAATFLKVSGYTVYCAVDGQEAVAEYQAAYEGQSAYDVVILDLTIPGGMGGQIAAQEILKINPQAKIIVSSGYSHDQVMANPAAYGFKGVLAKPYLFPALKKELQRILTEADPV